MATSSAADRADDTADDSVAARFDALVGGLDYPMFIVTATDGERRAGCLVGFATQCGIDPPRFMVWLSKNNHTHDVARRAGLLAVHVPTSADRALAELFGSRTGHEVDKFALCDWHPGAGGVPVLADCPQWFVGRVLSRHDTGDHEGFLLDVVDAGEATGGQLSFQDVKDLEPGHEA
ncbi:flavin reductase family protein [Actinophytocola sp.]|uniref:flavin reductase family protein n=1 Tax=Actinophytocola sp. TaxID=1872138 RepID=UPI002ED975F2